MKVAIVGSRGISLDNLGDYLPDECDEIISGGARGVDSSAAKYARAKGIKLTEFLPDYNKYGRGAPLVRNKAIVNAAELIVAFWDGHSRGTAFVINYCKAVGKKYKVILIEK